MTRPFGHWAPAVGSDPGVHDGGGARSVTGIRDDTHLAHQILKPRTFRRVSPYRVDGSIRADRDEKEPAA